MTRRGLLASVALATLAILAFLAPQALGATSRPSETPITATQVPGLSNPFALAVDSSDNLWLSDTGTSKVTELDSSGALLAESEGAGPWAGSGQIKGLAFAETAAEILVADSKFDDLWGLKDSDATSSGTDLFGGAWDPGHSGCCFIKDAVDNSGTATDGGIYVASEGNNSVSRVRATGLETFEGVAFSETAPSISGEQLTGPFSSPSSIAVDAVGDIYVGAANGVYVYEPSGKLIHSFTEAGGVSLTGIEAIAVDPTTGAILAAKATSILELGPTGALEAQITEADAAPFGKVQGLAVDSTGTLYASDGPNHQIDVFGPAVALPPESDGGSVTDVTSTSATLRGLVNPNGHPTSYFFQFGIADCTIEPGACTEIPAAPLAIGSGEVTLAVSQHLSGLHPATTYHYRLIFEDTEAHSQILGPDRTFTTQSTAASILPDSRQWELVSPPEKRGSVIAPITESGVVQAAVSGDAISYRANAPTEEDLQGFTNGVQILSTRGVSGWGTRNLGVPQASASGEPVGPGKEYTFFTDDLSAAFVQPFGSFTASISPEATEQTAFLHTDFPIGDPSAFCTASCYHPLVTGAPGVANVPPGTVFGQINPFSGGSCPKGNGSCGPEFLGATGDGSHAVLRSSVPLTTGAPSQRTLYEWNAEAPPARQLQPISLLPGGAPAVEPGLGFGSTFGTDVSARNAISADASLVFWEAGLEALYMRDTERGETIQLDVAEPACLAAEECESGGGRFQLASADGSRVFFTDSRPLTAGAAGGYSSTEGDLYECHIVQGPGGAPECDLTDLTPEVGGEKAAVQNSVIGASQDGSWIYFVANGVLATNADSNGEHAVAGQCRGEAAEHASPPGAHCNLYLRHGAETRLVSVLSAGDIHDWAEMLREMPARVSANGEWLAFMSQRSLSGYDNRDLATDKPIAEVYLYGAGDDRVVCASCDPSGARSHGVEFLKLEPREQGLVGGPRGSWEDSALVAANVPGWTGNARDGLVARHQPRYLSDSGRLFFNTVNGLVPQDSNGTQDVYQYEPPSVGDCSTTSPTYSPVSEGCVGLISSGTSGKESAFLDASESGNDVFFLTSARLAPQDTDSARDVYDAHVCTSGLPCLPPPPPPAPACSGDACQLPATPPVDATPGSLTFNGAGNVKECAKGKQLKKGKCVAKKKAKKQKKNHGKKKHGKKKGNGNKKSAAKKKGGK